MNRETDDFEKSMQKKVHAEFLEIFAWASSEVVNPDIEDHEFQFCKDAIQACIQYLDKKRGRRNVL